MEEFKLKARLKILKLKFLRITQVMRSKFISIQLHKS